MQTTPIQHVPGKKYYTCYILDLTAFGTYANMQNNVYHNINEYRFVTLPAVKVTNYRETTFSEDHLHQQLCKLLDIKH